MTAQKTTPRRIGAALLALTLTGCAQVIGIDDFTLTGGSSGGADTDPCIEANGCQKATAVSREGLSAVTLNFGAGGFQTPCTIIDSGTEVTFDAGGYTFEDLPIVGGVYPDADPDSPIKNPSPANVTTTSFTVGSECSYPFFLKDSGKGGVIFTK